MEYVFLILLFIIWVFIAYRSYVMTAALRQSISDWVNIQEVIVTKIDKIAACLDALPHELRREHDSIKRDEKRAKATRVRRKRKVSDDTST